MARNDHRFTPEPPTRAGYEREEFAVSAAEDEFQVEDFSEDLDENEDARFRRASRRVPVRKGAVTRKTAVRLRWGLVAGGMVLLLAGAAFGAGSYGLHSWRFRLNASDNIETAGLKMVARSQVMEVMGSDIGRNIFKVPLEDRKRQLEDIPWVESASVMRLLPDKVRVSIVERRPVAFFRSGSKVALIDATGVVMDIPPRQKLAYSFPVITGIAESEPLSTRASRMKAYLKMVGDLDANGANYSRDLSEVDLADPDDVRVTVEDPGGALVVHLGNADFLDRYRIYIRHINDWRQQFNKLDSVDLRFNGQIIVNPETRDRQQVSTPSKMY